MGDARRCAALFGKERQGIIFTWAGNALFGEARLGSA